MDQRVVAIIWIAVAVAALAAAAYWVRAPFILALGFGLVAVTSAAASYVGWARRPR